MDYVLAYMWANLAAAQGQELAVQLRDVLVEEMTSNQIAEAQRLAREWKPLKESTKELRTSDKIYRAPPSVNPGSRSIYHSPKSYSTP